VYLYTLDALNRRQYLIDQFQSLIWTERWQAYGDFQLNIQSNYAARSLLKPDTWLAMNKSNYVMRIESVEDDDNADGSRNLIVRGRDISAIFDDRLAPGIPSSTLSPGDTARQMFHQTCVTGVWDLGDIIPGITEGTFMPASTIPEPVDPMTIAFDTTPSLFEGMVTDVLVKYDLGFRILRLDSTGGLYFDIYAGSDRTSDQTTLTPVIFSPKLDNLQNTKELTDISKAKNVAYVKSDTGAYTIVYGVGVDPTTNSFERRVLQVDASSITGATTAQLQQAGLEALAASRTSFLFDGEVSQQSQYKYGTDYNLGDLIEQQNIDGVATNMRVTEQIFSQDSTGEKYYPTLVAYETINAGSWLAWNNNKTWSDLDSDTTDVWGNQP
jgi:hypothetical protein